jgi:hypothetical protein
MEFLVRIQSNIWLISAEGVVMRLNVGYLLDFLREIGGNFGLSRLEWRCRVGFAHRFQGTIREKLMSKRKRKIYVDSRIKEMLKSFPGYSTGASMSEAFPGFIEREEIYIDITNKVKPYTRSIILHVRQHGKELGAIQMTRRP